MPSPSGAAARPRRIRRLNRLTADRVVWTAVLLLMGAFMALPLVYSLVNSFKPIEELFIFPPKFYVMRPTADNYYELFKLMSSLLVPFSRYLFNTLFISVTVTVGHVILSSMAAYPLAKYRLKAYFLFPLVVMTLLFNGTVCALPQYILMAKLHVINTYLVYVLPILPMPLGLFLMKQFMEKLPFSLVESAQMDGANQFTIFWRIIMPQVKPGWLTLTVFAFQNVWNQQPANMVYDENLKLVNMAITQINNGGIARTGVSMAAGVLLMVPGIVVFLLTQSGVMETMASSGIKE